MTTSMTLEEECAFFDFLQQHPPFGIRRLFGLLSISHGMSLQFGKHFSITDVSDKVAELYDTAPINGYSDGYVITPGGKPQHFKLPLKVLDDMDVDEETRMSKDIEGAEEESSYQSPVTTPTMKRKKSRTSLKKGAVDEEDAPTKKRRKKSSSSSGEEKSKNNPKEGKLEEMFKRYYNAYREAFAAKKNRCKGLTEFVFGIMHRLGGMERPIPLHEIYAEAKSVWNKLPLDVAQRFESKDFKGNIRSTLYSCNLFERPKNCDDTRLWLLKGGP